MSDTDTTTPSAQLTELTQRMLGKWRVQGPGIHGQAEYRSAQDGLALVLTVDFVVNGTEMKVIQHIAHDQDGDRLLARYMDSMGDASTYTWDLEGKHLRIGLAGQSDTFFEASFNDDDSAYTGTWHYPDDSHNDAAEEQIVYSRIEA